MNGEKSRLKSEAKQVSDLIEAEVNELLKAKSVSYNLNQLLEKYTSKLKTQELAKLKLVDRVEIKTELKARLIKEIEGIRTNGNEYTELNKMDPNDLNKIVHQIKKKLGY